jgi:hypothetical protein
MFSTLPHQKDDDYKHRCVWGETYEMDIANVQLTIKNWIKIAFGFLIEILLPKVRLKYVS